MDQSRGWSAAVMGSFVHVAEIHLFFIDCTSSQAGGHHFFILSKFCHSPSAAANHSCDPPLQWGGRCSPAFTASVWVHGIKACGASVIHEDWWRAFSYWLFPCLPPHIPVSHFLGLCYCDVPCNANWCFFLHCLDMLGLLWCLRSMPGLTTKVPTPLLPSPPMDRSRAVPDKHVCFVGHRGGDLMTVVSMHKRR